MMLTKKMIVILSLLLSVGVTTFGCNKGPAEEAGEKVDKAVEDAGEKMKEVTE